EEAEEALDDDVVKVNNIVNSFRLQSTSFDKKGYLSYLKGYMKAVKAHLQETGASAEEITKFEKGAQTYFDAKAAHIAKLRAITRYLHGPTAGEDDDLVIVVDGFDVLAQIPAETLIQRYFDVAAAADQRLADQRGLTVEEVHSKGLRQTVLWGTDKGCFPSSGNGDEKQRDPRCWLVPFSTLPRYVWGPETGTGGLPFSDSRFVNSGTVIGPLGDLRTLIDATLALIEDTFDPEYKYHNSDQYYVSTLYARQEYQR
ncbi:hypothetical protein BN1708_017729, partial [Verticillium longisporum]